MRTKNILLAEEFASRYNKRYKSWPLQRHVDLVRKSALELADIEKADKEVVEIAAILHDIGKYKDNKTHHEISYNLAKEFVNKLELSGTQKDLILKCVLKHRFKFVSEDNEIEVKIIQSADALGSLFDDELQENRRKTKSKEDMLSLYEKSFKKISLDSARKLAVPRIKELKGLL
jgi:putative nucleotidyltransferase with HDIG domain